MIIHFSFLRLSSILGPGIPPDKANPTNIRLGVDQMGAEPDIQQASDLLHIAKFVVKNSNF